MKKVANEKKQMVKIYFGFYDDKNYGADYDAIRESINLSDLMRFYTTDANEFKKIDTLNTNNFVKLCPDIPKDFLGCSALPIYVQLSYLSAENAFYCTFKIGD